MMQYASCLFADRGHENLRKTIRFMPGQAAPCIDTAHRAMISVHHDIAVPGREA